MNKNHKNQKPESEMVELSKAITRALIRSEEVIKILDELKKNNRLQPNAMLAFILKTDALLDIYTKRSQTESDEELNSTPRKLLSAGEDEGIYIDGRQLTENELSFEEYFSSNFDEKKWLKELKIKF